MASAAFSPPGPATIASGGARLGRRCWTATRPRSGRSRQGSKPKAETPKGVRFTTARRAGLVPARAPHLPAPFSPYYNCRDKGFSDALGWFDVPQISQTMVDSILGYCRAVEQLGGLGVSKSGDITKKRKIAAKSLAHRLTGFSLPFFGVQWTPPADEREIIRGLLTALEDRRVLFVPYHLEVVSQVTASVLQMRELLTQTLQALPETARAAGSVRAMRAACRKFLEEPHPDFRNLPPWYGRGRFGDEEGSPPFFVALGELRATFGTHAAALAYQYGIDIEGELASILPSADDAS